MKRRAGEARLVVVQLWREAGPAGFRARVIDGADRPTGERREVVFASLHGAIAEIGLILGDFARGDPGSSHDLDG